VKRTCREWKGDDGIKKFEKHWFIVYKRRDCIKREKLLWEDLRQQKEMLDGVMENRGQRNQKRWPAMVG